MIGQNISEDSQKQNTYISINTKIKIRVDTDCLIVESVIGKEKDGKDKWGNYKYFTSWDGLFTYLIRLFTIEKLNKKELWSFIEARKEIISAIKDVKNVLLNEMNSALSSGKEEIKKFNN